MRRKIGKVIWDPDVARDFPQTDAESGEIS
jgi:hypothetical protein